MSSRGHRLRFVHTLADTLEPCIHDAMDRLLERERYVIEMRFGINNEREHTVSEIASSTSATVREIGGRRVGPLRDPHGSAR